MTARAWPPNTSPSARRCIRWLTMAGTARPARLICESEMVTPGQQCMGLDTAVKIASAQNVSEITLEQLTRASGVSAFDIVRHYHSKENILVAVLERELDLMAAAVAVPELRFPGETLRDEVQVIAKVMLNELQGRLPF